MSYFMWRATSPVVGIFVFVEDGAVSEYKIERGSKLRLKNLEEYHNYKFLTPLSFE